MDGHLQQGAGQKGRLTVEINARDIHILRNFRDLTPYYSNISERARSTNFAETHHSATWSLYSLEARKKLSELGLPHGRKSKRIAPPRVDFSRRDYLRGVIDADGSVGRTSEGFPLRLPGHREYGHCGLPVLLRQADHRRRAHAQAQRPRRHLQRPVHEGRRQRAGGTPLLRELPFPVPQTGSRVLARRLGTTGRHEDRSLPPQVERMGGPSAAGSRRRGVRG
jgi:hypothetical protein